MNSIMPTPDKEEIIKQLKCGDDSAMDVLFKMYNESFTCLVSRFVDNEGQAKDIVANAFIKVWERKEFESLAKIRSYMYMIIKNACTNYLNFIRRRTFSHEEIFYLSNKSEDYVEIKMIKSQMFGLILQEVENLPPVRKKIFKMIYLDDLSTFEIASRLNISEDTVRVQKARAINGLRSQILKKGIM